MLAIELVRDRTSREPNPEVTARIYEQTRHEGIVLSLSGPHC
jgi:alanine-glyoxylate transaminase/(R)-3-amino-2-methylpropionate-pyruvate transaminase